MNTPVTTLAGPARGLRPVHLLSMGACMLMQVLHAQPTGWNNGGGDPGRTAHVNVIGPDQNTLLWQVSSPGAFGAPVYIEGSRFVTMRFLALTQAPVECRDLASGALLWSREVTGGTGRSLPIGFRDGQVYVMRLTESLEDSLFALDALTGDRNWASPVTISTHITCSANFADNGDLFVEGWDWSLTQGYMRRIDRTDGSLIWECPISPVNIGASELTVNGNKGYLAESIAGVTQVTAIELTTGQRLYSHPVNDTQPGGGENYCPIVVDDAGTIFYHKLGDNVSAFSDNGTQLTLLWETPVQGYAPFSQMCLGADGTLYAPSNGQVIRLDPATGAILNTSAVISQNPLLFQMRASSPDNDLVYVSNGENDLHVFTPDLQTLWTDATPNINTGGMSISPGGLVVVTGAGTIKSYKPNQTNTSVTENGGAAWSVQPNPASDMLLIALGDMPAGADFSLLDATGRTLLHGRLHGGSTTLPLSAIPPGVHLLRIGQRTVKVVKE